MLLSSAIERLYDLNVGTTPLEEGAPHEKPHKPLLLLAVFDLIGEGLANPECIPWCQELRDRFTARSHLVRKHNNLDLPCHYLAGGGLWEVLIVSNLRCIFGANRLSSNLLTKPFKEACGQSIIVPSQPQASRSNRSLIAFNSCIFRKK